MVIEEAGQVLESHILASLVQSVQQLIMIGDPLQLRPSVNNYSKPSITLKFSDPILTNYAQRAIIRQPQDREDLSI